MLLFVVTSCHRSNRCAPTHLLVSVDVNWSVKSLSIVLLYRVLLGISSEPAAGEAASPRSSESSSQLSQSLRQDVYTGFDHGLLLLR